MDSKKVALAIIPKCTGFLSFSGSLFILQDVLRRKERFVYHRLVLFMSIFDIIASVVNMFSTMPIPSDTPGVLWAKGNQATCIAQGFFNELGNISTPMYNASLCAHYLLIFRNNWSERKMKTIEYGLHAVPLLFGFTMAILGLVFDLFNPSGWLCWYAPFPQGCAGDECERGKHASLFRWIHYFIIWSSILFNTLAMFLIFKSVRDVEKKTRRFSLDENYQSRKVAKQALFFVGALYLTWFFTTGARVYSIVHKSSNYPLLLLMAIFFPLQGFWNAMVYLRPRFIRIQKEHPDYSLCELLVEITVYSHTPKENRPSAGTGVNGSFLSSILRRRSSYFTLMRKRTQVELSVNESKISKTEKLNITSVEVKNDEDESKKESE